MADKILARADLGQALNRWNRWGDEGLLSPDARDRELRPFAEALTAFPHAEPLVVAGALPPPGSGEIGVPVMSLGRFLAAGVEDAASAKGVPVESVEPDALKVLDHLRQHGKITRREVSRLCTLTPPRATRLLSRLLAEGEITRQGTGRGTWYVLADAKSDPAD